MRPLSVHRLLAAILLIALTLALLPAQPGLAVDTGGAPGGMTTSMPDHCDDCGDRAAVPGCADHLCSGTVALVVGDGLPVATAAPRAERARIPLFHPGRSPAPEPQPPRQLISA